MSDHIDANNMLQADFIRAFTSTANVSTPHNDPDSMPQAWAALQVMDRYTMSVMLDVVWRAAEDGDIRATHLVTHLARAHAALWTQRMIDAGDFANEVDA